MAREYGYVSLPLSNLAADISTKAREGLVAPRIFPRIVVAKPAGKYAVFDEEDALKVPDAAPAGERSRANEFYTSGGMEGYKTSRYGSKAFIEEDEPRFIECPFKLWARRHVETPVTKPEPAQEKRAADVALNLIGRAATPSGKGTATGRK
ncbi:MAG: hypothetical protein LBB61_04585 [Treponema sp.]|jgi:hypothetical protein|nr:hypothetical protein [Treponema sp.]